MVSRIRIIMAVLLLCASCAYAVWHKDPRFMPISMGHLKQAIEQTPIDSDQQARLTARADASRLQKETYETYTTLWKKNPSSAHANLRRGIAAQQYWQHLFRSRRNAAPSQAYEVYKVARSCLAKAVQLQPKSVPANVAYGFFLWQYDNQMDEGLALVRKAVSLAPKDARAHANLGNIYSNPSGNAYNPQKAEEELQKAVALDSSYAYPHWLLISLYVNTKKFKEAQREMEAYLKLAPEGAAQDEKIFQTAIDKGLGKK